MMPGGHLFLVLYIYAVRQTESEKKMTKKNEKRLIVWKLKELPTGTELARMVEQGILNAEEARQIALRTEEDNRLDEAKSAYRDLERVFSEILDFDRGRTKSIELSTDDYMRIPRAVTRDVIDKYYAITYTPKSVVITRK